MRKKIKRLEIRSKNISIHHHKSIMLLRLKGQRYSKQLKKGMQLVAKGKNHKSFQLDR